MRKLLSALLVAAAIWGAWVGLSQTDILDNDVRFRVHGEYGTLLRGRP